MHFVSELCGGKMRRVQDVCGAPQYRDCTVRVYGILHMSYGVYSTVIHWTVIGALIMDRLNRGQTNETISRSSVNHKINYKM